MSTVAFDVDGTLIDETDRPRQEIIDMLIEHSKQGDTVVVWSGGGIDYALTWVSRLGLTQWVDRVVSKGKGRGIDKCYDDQIVNLADENVCVGTGEYEERW